MAAAVTKRASASFPRHGQIISSSSRFTARHHLAPTPKKRSTAPASRQQEFDSVRSPAPDEAGGIASAPSVTSAGMREPEMEQIGNWIADVLASIGTAEAEQRIRAEVAELAAKFQFTSARKADRPLPTTRA